MDATEWDRGAMRPLILLAMMLTLLAACAEREEETVDLSLTCQLTKCVCVGPSTLFLEKDEPEPVLWRENGDAYCSEGLELKLAED